MSQLEALEELKAMDCIWISCKVAARCSGLGEHKLHEAIKNDPNGRPYNTEYYDGEARIHRLDFIAFCEGKSKTANGVD